MKALLAVLSLVSAQYAGAAVLATVGKAKITTEDFQKKLNDVKKQASNPPTPEQYLEDLIRYEVGVQEAEKMKLADDPLVKERFKQVLYNSLLEKELGKKVEAIKINDNEMKGFYKKNPELHIAHILIDMKQNATPAERETTKKRAMEILDEVKKSKRPFEELVKLYSDDSQTKEMGGDIGFQSRVTLLPAVYDVAVNMKEGEVKGLVETRYGFHIIKLIYRRSYDLADKQQIRAALFDVKRAKLFNDYFEKAKKGYKVEINREALKSVKN
jgi:peptidyl-prolyl cis-trans isomerase C/peptidyl-prolyl cis-trans isomerase D